MISLVLLTLIKIISCGKCPPKQVSHPCVCESKIIKCEGNQSFNLKLIFQKISEYLNEDEKSFNFFLLNNEKINEFEENVFADITFRFITIIDAKSLQKISANAFKGNEKTIEVFEQRGDMKLKNMTQLFVAINSLESVVSITLNLFEMKSLPSYAFYNLNRLQELNLINGQLNYISAKSLSFEKKSDESLIIDLTFNNLTEFSFNSESFIDVKRPLELDLRENQLRILDEHIFRPFLLSDVRNSVNMRANPLNCFDCRMEWLVKEKNQFIERVIDARCAHFVDIFELQLIDFKHCHK